MPDSLDHFETVPEATLRTEVARLTAYINRQAALSGGTLPAIELD